LQQAATRRGAFDVKQWTFYKRDDKAIAALKREIRTDL
jgi:hypothetical protein